MSGSTPSRRVWFRFIDDFHSVVGDFEYVSDLCSAIHAKLGKASPSAVCLQLAVSGRVLSPTAEVSRELPSTCSLHPKNDPQATPVELVFRSQFLKVGQSRPRRTASGDPRSKMEAAQRGERLSNSRPSSRGRPQHYNPTPGSDSESISTTSCDDALLTAAIRQANRHSRHFEKNPHLRGKDYIDRHVEKIADQLNAKLHERIAEEKGSDAEQNSRETGEWVVMLCPPAPGELTTRIVTCPPRRLDRCLDVIRHLQRSIPDFLVTEAFFYDEGLKDYVPLNDASIATMTGLLFVLVKPHRALSLGLHQLPEVPRPDNIRSAVMMGEFFNRMQGFLRGLEVDENNSREQLDSLEHQQRVTLAMYEAQLQQAIDEIRRRQTAGRTETPPKRRPWYEKVSPCATPSPSKEKKGSERITPTAVGGRKSPVRIPAPPRAIDASPEVKSSPVAPLGSSVVQAVDAILEALCPNPLAAAAPSTDPRSPPKEVAASLIEEVLKEVERVESRKASPVKEQTQASALPADNNKTQHAAPAPVSTTSTAPGQHPVAPSPIAPDPLPPKPVDSTPSSSITSPPPSATAVAPEVHPHPPSHVPTRAVPIVHHQQGTWMPHPHLPGSVPELISHKVVPVDHSKAPEAVVACHLPEPKTTAESAAPPAAAAGPKADEKAVAPAPTKVVPPIRMDPKQLFHCVNGGFTATGASINEGRTRSVDDAVLLRQFWFSIPNRSWTVGDQFFQLALGQHPSLMRTLMRGWDFVKASTQLTGIIEQLLCGTLTESRISEVVAEAIDNVVIVKDNVEDRYFEYFVTMMLSTLSKLTPEDQRPFFHERLQVPWRIALTAVAESFKVALRAPVQVKSASPIPKAAPESNSAVEGTQSTAAPASQAQPTSTPVVTDGKPNAEPANATLSAPEPVATPPVNAESKPDAGVSAPTPTPLAAEKDVQAKQISEILASSDGSPLLLRESSSWAFDPMSMKAAAKATTPRTSVESLPKAEVRSAPVAAEPAPSPVASDPVLATALQVASESTPVPATAAAAPPGPTEAKVQSTATQPTPAAPQQEPVTHVPIVAAQPLPPQRYETPYLAPVSTTPSEAPAVAPAGPAPVAVDSPKPLTTPGPATASSTDRNYKGRLTRFFEKYCPEMVPTVDSTLSRVAGAEEALFVALVTRYGPEPQLA
jgi:hypothetical protein